MEKDKILPFENEFPSHYADRLGAYYTSIVESGHKKEHGQFFTPIEIAQFMGDLTSLTRDVISILDPGCGTGILTCALIERLIEKAPSLREVVIDAFETDTELISLSEQSFSYLKKWAGERNVDLHFIIHIGDFILINSDCLIHEELAKTQYDIIIANPPYFKLSKDDPRAIAAQKVIYGQPNIYSIFLSIAAQLLKSSGELVFITPRSFSSGHYFRLFRKFFFNAIALERIHLFHSRKDTFGRDNVLQETLIIKARKRSSRNVEEMVTLSSSNSIKDLLNPTLAFFSIHELVDLNSKEKILHLPTNEQEEHVIKLFKSWKGNLGKYNIQISTGPVVSFREKGHLRQATNGILLAPLYWLHNVTKMTLTWPLTRPGKEQYIEVSDSTKNILLPNKNYIFLRRFSSKDDKSRLIATPYFHSPDDVEFIGVENKLNYLYRPKGHLDRNEILGLSALLNSSLFDTFFRTFNGNINVSATELREMPLPDLEVIKRIGDQLILDNNFSEANIDEIVESFVEYIPISNE